MLLRPPSGQPHAPRLPALQLPLGAKILGGAIDSLVVSQGLVRAYQVVNKVEVQKGTFSYTQGTSTYTKSESMGSYVAERSNATYQARRHSLPFTPPPSPPPLAAASLPEQRAGAHAWVFCCHPKPAATPSPGLVRLPAGLRRRHHSRLPGQAL